MVTPRVKAAGGFAAMKYVLAKGRSVGTVALYRRLRSNNACKTCALGMGGQQGGMVNEAGHFPEVCKKSVQAQAADMGKTITEADLRRLSIGELSGFTSAQAEAMGRLTFPIVCGPNDTHFRRVPWDEAMCTAADAFTSTEPDRSFFYASGRSSNEAAFLMQVVARAYGTNNVNNCSYYCHQASGVALTSIYGSGTASVSLDDLGTTELALVIGANPASNHPRLITQLINLRRRGGKVIVINPLSELGLKRFRLPSQAKSLVIGSQVSDLYIQPHIGGDIALMVALLKGIIESGTVNESYIAQHTESWEAVRDAAIATSWGDLVERSGVARSDIDACVELLGTAKSAVFMWAMGLTHHAHGVDNVRALANVAMARGFLGSPGSGLMPIRGHSNVQGIGSVGVSPQLKESFAKSLREKYGVIASTTPGMDTYACMNAAHEGRIDAALMLGGNLWGSNPDSRWSTEALSRIGTSVSLTTKLNQGHFNGRARTTVVLPVLARDEEPESTTQESMFNFVRLSDGGTPAVDGEMRSEVAILSDLAQRILPRDRFDWSMITSHDSLRRAIADTVPGYGAVGGIGNTKKEFEIPNRVFHDGVFPTASGRATFRRVAIPEMTRPFDGFMLMTIRSEGQFNSVVYDEEDLYRGTTRRDVIMMAAKDIALLGLNEGETVTVTSATGSLDVVVAEVDIRAGNVAMYYPEANVLVDRTLDPESLTPAFKSVAVRVERRAA
ncbi:MAG: Formate dehydrogenase [Actinomycetota bacterium]|jgi:molybdopterin-dependent oxidoreductase alpha subunit